MTLAPATHAAIAVIRCRTASRLPAFLLTPALSTVIRVVCLAGLATADACLGITGRLPVVRPNDAELDLELPNPNTEPEALVQ